MLNFKFFLILCITFNFFGCVPANSSTERSSKEQVTPSASRLRLLRHLSSPGDLPSDLMLSSLYATLWVKQDGSISKSEFNSGSGKLWIYLQRPISKLNFIHTSSIDTGPWKVKILISTGLTPTNGTTQFSSETAVPLGSLPHPDGTPMGTLGYGVQILEVVNL